MGQGIYDDAVVFAFHESKVGLCVSVRVADPLSEMCRESLLLQVEALVRDIFRQASVAKRNKMLDSGA